MPTDQLPESVDGGGPESALAAPAIGPLIDLKALTDYGPVDSPLKTKIRV
jgi:hypothetical protein